MNVVRKLSCWPAKKVTDVCIGSITQWVMSDPRGWELRKNEERERGRGTGREREGEREDTQRERRLTRR